MLNFELQKLKTHNSKLGIPLAMTHLPALRLLLTMTLGILLGASTPAFFSSFLIAAATLATLTLSLLAAEFFTEHPSLKNVYAASYTLTVVLFFAAYTAAVTGFVPQDAVMQYATGNAVLTGTVESTPALRDGGRFSTAQWTLNAERLIKGRDTVSVSGKVRVRISSMDGLETFAQKTPIGTRLVLTGKLSLPPTAQNLGEFDYRAFLAQKDIFTVMQVFGTWRVERTGRRDLAFLEKLTLDLHDALDRKIESLVPKGDERSFLKGLLLGDRSGVSDEVRLAFQKTGTIHVLAISGLHIALLVSVLNLFFLRLKVSAVGKGSAFLLTAALLVLYSSLTGNSPPVVRAVLMALVFLIADLLQQKSITLNSLAFAAALMLAFRPADVFDGSFLLTNAAVASLILFYPAIRAWIEFDKETWYGKPLNAVWASLAVTLAATIGVAPFIAYYFGSVSLFGTLANLPIVLLTNLAVYAMLPALLFESFSPALAQLYADAAFWMIRVSIRIAEGFSAVPYATAALRATPWVMMLFYAVVFTLFNLRSKHRAKLTLLSLALLNAVIWSEVWNGTWNSGEKIKSEARVIINAVGRGASVIIKTGNQAVLIDAGTAALQHARIQKQLEAWQLPPLSATVSMWTKDSLMTPFPAPVRLTQADTALKLSSAVMFRASPALLKVKTKPFSILFASRLKDLEVEPFYDADVLIVKLARFGQRERLALETYLSDASPVRCVVLPSSLMKRADRLAFYRFTAHDKRIAVPARDGQLVLTRSDFPPR